MASLAPPTSLTVLNVGVRTTNFPLLIGQRPKSLYLGFFGGKIAKIRARPIMSGAHTTGPIVSS